MIKLTLNFSTVAAARKALNELPEDLFAHVGEIAPAPEQEKAPEKKSKPAATQPAPAPAQPEVAAPAPAAESPSSVDYPTLQKAVFALAGKSRDVAGEVVSTFGVKTFKDLDQSRWGEALAAVQAKIAELG